MSNKPENVKHIVECISTVDKRRIIAMVYKGKNKKNKSSSRKYANSIRNTISVKLFNALRKLF